MDVYKDAIETLRRRGYRITRQRRLILDILLNSQEHLDAESLYSRARKEDKEISLATVYRSLALLKEAGLVQEHRLGESHGHFESTPQSPHYHFTCLKCGRVIEFTVPQVMDAVHELSEQYQLDILQVHLHMVGYCAKCSQPAADCGDL